MVLGVQVAGALFGVFMMYYTFLKYKRKEFSSGEYLCWMVLWVAFVAASLFPNILDPFVKSLSFARTFDFLVVVGFLFIIGLTFYTYTIVNKSKKQVEELARVIAMRKK
jgi:hypothetical protein